MSKIGIFGGTFDPFHLGHMSIVVNSFKQLKLDKMYIVPTVVNYYRNKRVLFNFDERVSIIQDFLVGFEHPVDISLLEKDKDEQWRALNTIDYFKSLHPHDELMYIIGEDSLFNFKTWYKWQEILNKTTLCVVNRDCKKSKLKVPDIDFECINIGKDFEECSSTNVRNILVKELKEIYLSDKDFYGWG